MAHLVRYCSRKVICKWVSLKSPRLLTQNCRFCLCEAEVCNCTMPCLPCQYIVNRKGCSLFQRLYPRDKERKQISISSSINRKSLPSLPCSSDVMLVCSATVLSSYVCKALRSCWSLCEARCLVVIVLSRRTELFETVPQNAAPHQCSHAPPLHKVCWTAVVHMAMARLVFIFHPSILHFAVNWIATHLISILEQVQWWCGISIRPAARGIQ